MKSDDGPTGLAEVATGKRFRIKWHISGGQQSFYLKLKINLFIYLFICLFFCQVACRTSVPQPGIEPMLSAVECGVLTTDHWGSLQKSVSKWWILFPAFKTMQHGLGRTKSHNHRSCTPGETALRSSGSPHSGRHTLGLHLAALGNSYGHLHLQGPCPLVRSLGPLLK